MNKFKFKLIISFILLISSSIVYSKAGWTENGYIQEIQVTTSGKLIIKGSIKGNQSGCKDEDLLDEFYRLKNAGEVGVIEPSITIPQKETRKLGENYSSFKERVRSSYREEPEVKEVDYIHNPKSTDVLSNTYDPNSDDSDIPF